MRCAPAKRRLMSDPWWRGVEVFFFFFYVPYCGLWNNGTLSLFAKIKVKVFVTSQVFNGGPKKCAHDQLVSCLWIFPKYHVQSVNLWLWRFRATSGFLCSDWILLHATKARMPRFHGHRRRAVESAWKILALWASAEATWNVGDLAPPVRCTDWRSGFGARGSVWSRQSASFTPSTRVRRRPLPTTEDTSFCQRCRNYCSPHTGHVLSNIDETDSTLTFTVYVIFSLKRYPDFCKPSLGVSLYFRGRGLPKIPLPSKN